MKYEEWQTKLEQLTRERDRAEGALERNLQELEQLGYKTVEDAEAALDDLQEELEAQQKKADKMEQAFEKEFGDLLQEQR